MSTFISVGNATQPFNRFLDMIVQFAPILPHPLRVQYGYNKFSCDDCQAFDFLTMTTFEKFVIDSDLLIFHAGAGSIMSAIRMGKVPVVMPRRKMFGEHVNDHQFLFAKKMAQNKKIALVHEPSELQEAIVSTQTIKQDNKVPLSSSQMLLFVKETIDKYAEQFK